MSELKLGFLLFGSLTNSGAQKQDLFHLPAIIVECQVPCSRVHVLNEACFLQRVKMDVPLLRAQVLRKFCLLFDQLLSIQELHKVKLKGGIKASQYKHIHDSGECFENFNSSPAKL